MSQTFSKTAKGQEEIKSRAGNINQRMRQILIFVDGKRSRDDLFGMLRGDDFDQQLKSLVDEGYVAVSGEALAKPAVQAAAQPAVAPKPVAPAAPAPAAPAAAVPSQAEIDARNKKRQQEQEAHEDVDAAHHFMSRM
ncbi:MAG: hypothetical protein JSS58_09985 [Proteobacteria bacterium]|nr:hypothetical protein [Pseudomonadota bacterium]